MWKTKINEEKWEMFKIKEHRPTRKLEFSSKSNFQSKNQTLSKDAVVSVLYEL